MNQHPNSVISGICSRAGIVLAKGDAARIHRMVPDLDPGTGKIYLEKSMCM